MIIFHVIGVICFNIFGYQAHKKSVDYFNWIILRCLNLLGTRFEMEYLDEIPKNVPIIIISNHQSMWDIPPIIWHFRKMHPKFVSKIELGRGIPAISYNLRIGGSILIDRKNPEQALGEMIKFGKYLVEHNRSGVIFPEGTRSKNGAPKTFHRKGLITLFKHAPEAYVLPISVNNSWKLQRYGLFPMPLGVRLKHTIHPALKISDFSSEELIDLVEETVKSKIVI
ncbi:MAG: 1-acyl-sn-glycerol-3-phosphate acyltransferase [Ulvibacter sp.]|jgi:1-acyl-sn-glycerol-3-phosphate acyltransferase|tara:strand:- start:538 stop:1212 length:675 start_codon:yes stop_codon:yes gene_type:complete